MKPLHQTVLPSGARLAIRAVDPAADLERIWQWWTAPHVLGNWSMLFRLGPPREGAEPYLLEDLRAYLERILAPGSEMMPLILRVDDREIGYSEAYRVGTSPLAKHPVVLPDDRGVHLILGEVAYAGRGLATEILAALSKWQLTAHPAAGKVMGDPDVRNQRAVKAVLKIPGSRFVDDYRLPYKTASVIVLATRETMEALW